ncbi:MAG: 4-hydroxy-2-oxovalerate aldolase [Gemmatimonadetes bacterium]|jgi:4-hydroxy-2-oxoheptanedioate aldolase|nr:4-hydroxy-2-oxovalerate aldolase [Gemmatimonadota bacterium]
MRESKLLKKIRAGECARVCATGHYLPFFVRYAAHFKFDAIWFDLEHRAMDQREVQSFLGMCYHQDIDAMVRPPTLERTRLYRYLEDGAAGFMMPFVSEEETAKWIVEAVKFPPLGNRGIDGAGLDADFGIEAWKEGSNYLAESNEQNFVMAQIETCQALENVEKIAAVEGIDVLFVGPADLGARLEATGGIPLEKAIEKVAETARKHGKAWGIPAGSPEKLREYRQMGAQVLVNGGDFALMTVLENCSKEFDEVLGELD